MSYRILFSRNDKAELKWELWAFGYPSFSIAETEKKKLLERNKDFDFKVEKGTKEESV